MSGKGSGRRPGAGYAEGWDAIFGRGSAISMIVDRDTPPDIDGDKVVDYDIAGKPITRRMVNAFAQAKQKKED